MWNIQWFVNHILKLLFKQKINGQPEFSGKMQYLLKIGKFPEHVFQAISTALNGDYVEAIIDSKLKNLFFYRFGIFTIKLKGAFRKLLHIADIF